MKFLMLLFLMYVSSSAQASIHPDNGEELCFEHTNVDHGLKYHKDTDIAAFPFVNCTGHMIILDTVYSNKDYSNTIYSFYNKKQLDTIYPGQQDTLFFKKRRLYSNVTGLYDNSFSIKFRNSKVVQHLNIFCEVDFNFGKLKSEDIQLPTVNRGETVMFTGQLYNEGTDPVTIKKPNYHGSQSNLQYLDDYPVRIMPGKTTTFQFALKTGDVLNQYEGSVAFQTNDGDLGSYRSARIKYSGKLISIGHPSIHFDSLVLHKFVDKNGDGSFEFWFENDGDEPLIIEQCKTSCGCLVASWPREPIEPGQRAVIKVKYDTKRIGPVNKSITVKTNAVSTPIILRVKGYVKNTDPPPANSER